MSWWRRLVGDRSLVTRLVLAVAGTMTVVLLAAGGFVFWRVQFALNRQLDQDLSAYQQVVERAVAARSAPVGHTAGQSYQVYALDGRVLSGDSSTRLVDRATVVAAATAGEQRQDVGRLLPAARDPYRVVTARLKTARGAVVVAAAISRSRHDEALRELLLQLGIADLATLVAASLVGYRTARAALRPVERYRVAAERADAAPLLPVDDGKDDEISRLGHTFNALLARIGAANERERQFLADTSHELRSPLAVMRAELEVALLRPRDEAETTTAFVSLRDQVERLIALSNELLDLEELRSTGAAVLDHVDLDALLAEVAAPYAVQARAAGRRLEVTTHGMLVPDGRGDLGMDGNRRWLDLALGNLVLNALRHGAGTITLDVTRSEDRTRLSVRDEGDGFPADFAAKAFDRFSRAETSRSTRGTGLGLALVQAVAEAHRGRARIDGARVTLDLPTRAATS